MGLGKLRGVEAVLDVGDVGNAVHRAPVGWRVPLSEGWY